MSQGREQQVGRVNEIDCCNADLIRFLFLRGANRDGIVVVVWPNSGYPAGGTNNCAAKHLSFYEQRHIRNTFTYKYSQIFISGGNR